MAPRRSNTLSIPQRLVLALAAAPLLLIGLTAMAWGVGLVDREAFVTLALMAGEDPGMLTFAALFLASPVQRLSGRTQVIVRPYLGLIFFAYAVSNYVLFLLEHPLADSAGQPFLIAGLVAMIAAAPLAATSNRWSQRRLGRRRWLLLHKLTYLVAAALVGHVILNGELGVGSTLIIGGFVLRIPAIAHRLSAIGDRRGQRSMPAPAPSAVLSP